jgi:hypothetical protein
MSDRLGASLKQPDANVTSDYSNEAQQAMSHRCFRQSLEYIDKISTKKVLACDQKFVPRTSALDVLYTLDPVMY